MDKIELSNDIKDILVRVEGTIGVLRKRDASASDIVRADRKLQGIRDKMQHLLGKVSREPDTFEDPLIRQIQELETV